MYMPWNLSSQYNQYHHSPYHHTPFSVFDNATIFSFIFLAIDILNWNGRARVDLWYKVICSVLMSDLSTIVCHVLNHSKPYQRYSRSYTIMPQLHHTIYVPNHAILYYVT